MHIIILIIVSLWYYPTNAYFEGSNYNLQLPITDTALNSCFYAPTKDFITHCGLKIDKYNNTIFHALAKKPHISNPIIKKIKMN